MSQKKRYFLLVLLLLIPLVVAACGGDDDKNNDGDKGETLAPALALTQSFDSATGISFQYPDGWVAGDADGEALAANNQASYDKMLSSDPAVGPAAGDAGMVFLVTSGADLGLPADADNDMVFGFTGEIMTSNQGLEPSGEAENITLGGKAGQKTRVKDLESGSEGVLVMVIDGGKTLVGVLMTGAGKVGDFEATALDIMGSATYSAP